MILYWLYLLGDWAVWLFAPVKARDVARINENEPCPVCGHRRGRLRTVMLNLVVASNTARKEIFCQHTCSRCGARRFEKPVVAVNTDMVFPAIARDAGEKIEDEQYGQPMKVNSTEAVSR